MAKPELPRLSYADVIRKRLEIQRMMRKYIGRKIKGGSTQKSMASDLWRKYSKSGSGRLGTLDVEGSENALYQALYETLSERYAGMWMTEELSLEIGRVVAGTLDSLRVGAPSIQWEGQKEHEWVLLAIVSAYRSITPVKRIHGSTLLFHVMTGSPSGEDFEQFFSDRAAKRLAKFIGLRGKYESTRVFPLEFGQMKVLGRVAPGDTLHLDEYRERPSLNDRNRKLVKGRVERTCPMGYRHPCYACPVSFRNCRLGTHRETFDEAPCKRCGKPGYFNPIDMGQKTCLACQVDLWSRQ